MNDDPIVAEGRRIRAGRARQFNCDIHAIFADLMAREHSEEQSHALVKDAREWVETKPEKDALVLRDQPKPKD